MGWYVSWKSADGVVCFAEQKSGGNGIYRQMATLSESRRRTNKAFLKTCLAHLFLQEALVALTPVFSQSASGLTEFGSDLIIGRLEPCTSDVRGEYLVASNIRLSPSSATVRPCGRTRRVLSVATRDLIAQSRGNMESSTTKG